MIPHCDLKTGKIYGCKTKSFKWWHEKGHFEFNKRELSSRLKLFQDYSFSLWMISITFAIVTIYAFIFSFVFLFFYLGVDIYEEYWCNKYAKLKIHKNTTNTYI